MLSAFVSISPACWMAVHHWPDQDEASDEVHLDDLECGSVGLDLLQVFIGEGLMQGKDLWRQWLQAVHLTLEQPGSGWQLRHGLTQDVGCRLVL